MPAPNPPARLWYQSFVHPTQQAPYIERLQRYLDSVAGPGVAYEVHGLDPPDHLFHPLTEFRCAAQTIRIALAAEPAGYDTFIIGHFQEPGLLEIRGALDIPVIGLGEATMLAALSMGGRIGLVTIDPIFIDWHERQIRMLGLEQRVAGIRAIKVDLPGFMRAFTDETAYSQVRPISWRRSARWSKRAPRSSFRPAASRCCCFPASGRSRSTARWCSTASPSPPRPRKWRWRSNASPDPW
jgi:Asp/Glu/hydantoin racemase